MNGFPDLVVFLTLRADKGKCGIKFNIGEKGVAFANIFSEF